MKTFRHPRLIQMIGWVCITFMCSTGGPAMAQPAPAAQLPGDLRLAILPFEDQRGTESRALTWLAFLPLMPFGKEFADRPEDPNAASGMETLTYDPLVKIPQTLAEEFQNTGLFREVRMSHGGPVDDADLIMKGIIRSTRWEQKVTAYGLSIPGMVLWMVGLPYAVTQNTLDMTLEFMEPARPDHVLWRADIHIAKGVPISPYYRDEVSQQSYLDFSRQSVHEIKEKLKEWILQNFPPR